MAPARRRRARARRRARGTHRVPARRRGGAGLRRRAPRAPASDEAYAPLPESDRRELVDDPADEPLGPLFELLGEAASLVCPDARTALERAGLADARRVPPTSDSAAAAMYPQIGNALAGPPTLLYATVRAGFPDVAIVLASPPIVALGPR